MSEEIYTKKEIEIFALCKILGKLLAEEKLFRNEDLVNRAKDRIEKEFQNEFVNLAKNF